MKLKMFDPPANMPEFGKIPGQREQWSAAISGWLDGAIEIEAGRLKDYKNAKVQFFNAVQTDPKGLSLDQLITWNAFPRTLVLSQKTKIDAYRMSEQLFSLTAPRPGLPTAPPFYVDPPGSKMWSELLYRPLDEYCEFRVERVPGSNKIKKVTFTSEPPEYWQAMHGDELQDIKGNFQYKFNGDKKLMLDLYRQYVSPKVTLKDLECKHEYYYMDGKNKVVVFRKGDYNPYNKWNSTHGLMHLSHPNNFVAAEIQLGADATILRQKNGNAVVQADALVCCAGYGGTSRSSDPTIGASVNDLARLGAWVTIKNPIGLYMHDLNTQGFTKPNGESIDPTEYFKVLRGDAKNGMIERAVFEVPEKEGFTVSDIKIGGVPILWAGQIAEHINITITGTAVAPGTFNNPMLDCECFCAINTDVSMALTRVIDNGQKIPVGYQETFLNMQGTFGSVSGGAAVASTARAKKAGAKNTAPGIIPHHKKRF